MKFSPVTIYSSSISLRVVTKMSRESKCNFYVVPVLAESFWHSYYMFRDVKSFHARSIIRSSQPSTCTVSSSSVHFLFVQANHLLNYCHFIKPQWSCTEKQSHIFMCITTFISCFFYLFRWIPFIRPNFQSVLHYFVISNKAYYAM